MRGLTLADVAAEIHVSERTINRWELYENDIPRKYWEPLAELFRVQVPWLLGIEATDDNGDNGKRTRDAA